MDEQTNLVLISDPGPDPDDVKAILVSAHLHAEGTVRLCCVICNGGEQAHERAALARCVLDHMRQPTIPVGVGTAGKAHQPRPHEYDLPGFAGAAADRGRLHDGAALLMRTLDEAAPASLTIVCISSLADFANAIKLDPALVLSRVKQVAIQGGLVREGERWTADASVNNLFDLESAQLVYDFCFERGLPMTVTSRKAVPMIPMQLAKSFARAHCPVMMYLADAQFLGLEGLWCKLCAGELPARCSRQWYFATFCGVSAEDFARAGYEELGAEADIVLLLNGFVLPYDVVALMTVLPITRAKFSPAAEHTVNGVRHLLLLEPEHTVSEAHVVKLLRNAYHDVVLATGAAGRLAPPAAHDSLDDSEHGGGGGGGVGQHGGGLSRAREGKSPRGFVFRQPAARAEGKALLRSRVETAWSAEDDLALLRPQAAGPAAQQAEANRSARPSNPSRIGLPAAVATEEAAGAESGGRTRAPVGERGRQAALAEVEKVLEAALHDARGAQTRVALWACVALLLAVGALLALGLAAAVAKGLHDGGGGGGGGGGGARLAQCGATEPSLDLALAPALLLLGLLLLPVREHRACLAGALALVCAHALLRAAGQGVLLAAASPALWQSRAPAGSQGESPGAAQRARAAWVLLALEAGLHLALGVAALALVARARAASCRRLLAGYRGMAWLWIAQMGLLALAAALLDDVEARDAPLCLASCALELLCAAALGLPTVLERGRSLVSRAIVAGARRGGAGTGSGAQHSSAWLAALLGHGTPTEHAPELLVAAAAASFCPVRLTALALQVADFGAQPEPPTRTLLGRTAQLLLGLHGRASLSRNLRRAWGVRPHAGAATADVLVVHSGRDAPLARLQALERWLGGQGREPPVVWLDVLCAEERCSPAERLVHALVHMRLSQRLLVLWGPRLADDIHALVLLWAWSEMGGSMKDVEVVGAVGTADEGEALIASVDAFALVHAASQLNAQEDGRRIASALRTYSVSRFNELVRGYLPLVGASTALVRSSFGPEVRAHHKIIRACAESCKTDGSASTSSFDSTARNPISLRGSGGVWSAPLAPRPGACCVRVATSH